MNVSFLDIAYSTDQNSVLAKAEKIPAQPAEDDKVKTLLLLIDYQLDFMPGGPLGVPGAHGDVDRMSKWIYDNFSKISQIAVSLDTHNPVQIFHPCWWSDADGNNPAPFTTISHEDVESGKWVPLYNTLHSKEYVFELERTGKKKLMIWPYHCLQGTAGVALDSRIAHMAYFHSIVRKAPVWRIVKGTDPDVEMYGIIQPEWDPKHFRNTVLLSRLKHYDRIVIGGEAKSHCVLESVQQLVNYYQDDQKFLDKVVVLEDTMSNIPGFEATTDFAFAKLGTQIKITKTTDFTL